MSVFALVDPVLQGLLLGGLYALFAIGLSLSFGIMRMVNIAHGDIIILGAYATLVVVDQLGIHPLAAMVVVVPVLAGFGYLLQRILLNPVLGEDILPPLLVTLNALKTRRPSCRIIGRILGHQSPGFGGGQSRKQHGGENRDNGNDHQEFDQRKPSFFGCPPGDPMGGTVVGFQLRAFMGGFNFSWR